MVDLVVVAAVVVVGDGGERRYGRRNYGRAFVASGDATGAALSHSFLEESVMAGESEARAIMDVCRGQLWWA